MRINKKLVDKGRSLGWIRNNGYGDHPEYYVNVDKVGGAFFRMMLVVAFFTVLSLGAVLFWSWTVPSKIETATYDKRCDIIAGKAAHYVTRASGSGSTNYVCAVAPDFHQVGM